jgi:hypothetical protein
MPAPTSITIAPFYGKPEESISEFLEQVDLIADKEKEAFQDADQHSRAKLILLKTNLRDRAKRFLRTLDQSTLESYLRISLALKNQYPEPKSDQGELLDRILELGQGKSESVKKYIKRAKRLAEDVGGNQELGGSLARKFVKGLRDRDLRLLVKAANTKDDAGHYSFHKTLSKVVELTEQDRQSDSESSASSELEDEVLSKHRKTRASRDRKWRGDAAKAEVPNKEELVKQSVGRLSKEQDEEIRKRIEELWRERSGGQSQFSNGTGFGFGGIQHIPQQVPVNAVYAAGPFNPSQPAQANAVYAQGSYGPQQQAYPHQYHPNQFQGPNYQSGPFQPAQPLRQGMSQQQQRTVTCYNCGKRGNHYKDQCSDPKASEEFRASIVARVARARAEFQARQLAMQQQPVTTIQQQPISGPSTANQQSSQDVNAMFVEESAMLNSALHSMQFAECYQLDEVQAAEKRKRSAVSEGEALGSKRQDMGEGRAFSEEDIRAGIPSAIQPANLPQPQLKKKRTPRDHVPIRMMKGQAAYDAVAALRDTEVRGLSWGNFFELAPKVKSQLAHGLVQKRPARKRKPKVGPSAVNAVAQENDRIAGKGKALPEPTASVANFYTIACISQPSSSTASGKPQWFRIMRTLIDGGSVLNMITSVLASKMKLTMIPQDEVSMRTAASTVHPIEFYVLIDIEIAGVIASIKCYVLPESISPSYSVLLGRRWMKQVRALGDYANDRYCIHDMAGIQYVLFPHQTPDDIRDEIPTLCVNQAATVKTLDEETISELDSYPESDSDSEYETILHTVQSQAWADMEYDASSEEESFADASESVDDDIYLDSGNVYRR